MTITHNSADNLVPTRPHPFFKGKALGTRLFSGPNLPNRLRNTHRQSGFQLVLAFVPTDKSAFLSVIIYHHHTFH